MPRSWPIRSASSSASLQGIGIAEIAEQLRAERQRKGQVERMTAAPRIGFHGPVRRQRLIGIAHHPEQLAAIDAVTGEGVGIGACREFPMSLRIVELEDLIAGAAGFGEFAEPVVAGGGGAVTKDFKAIVAELSAGLGELPRPAQQFRQLARAHIVHRQGIQDRQISSARASTLVQAARRAPGSG